MGSFQFDLMEIVTQAQEESSDARVKQLAQLLRNGQPLPEALVKTTAQTFGRWLVYNAEPP